MINMLKIETTSKSNGAISQNLVVLNLNTALWIFIVVLSTYSYRANAQFDYSSFRDDLYPKSPQAAGLAKYVDYPVDKSSGVINVSIPIYTIKARGFELPISLDYHTGGVKVDQLATSVGLGWVLNAGGMITRTVKGTWPDEAGGVGYGGYLVNGKIPDNYQTILTRAFPPPSGIYPPEPEWDMQPDQFYLNCAGLTGSFIHDYQGNIHLIPEQDIKIEDISTIGMFNSWQVTRPDGTKFIFRDTEKSRVEFKIWNGSLQQQYPGVNNVSSAWMVNEIITSKNDKIEFIYGSEEVVKDFVSTSGFDAGKYCKGTGIY